MIAKLERTKSYSAKQDKHLTIKPHKQWEQQQTMNKSRPAALELTIDEADGGLR